MNSSRWMLGRCRTSMPKSASPNTSVQYVADLANVKEVTLHGTADLSFWEAVLHKENLFPYHEGDKAILLLSAIAAKWRGFRFKEFVIAVGICFNENGKRLDGYYLPHAFNASKLLAFSERVFFRTPYFHGNIRLENRLPASIRLQDKTEVLFQARMSVPGTPPIVEYLEWEGPIFFRISAVNSSLCWRVKPTFIRFHRKQIGLRSNHPRAIKFFNNLLIAILLAVYGV